MLALQIDRTMRAATRSAIRARNGRGSAVNHPALESGKRRHRPLRGQLPRSRRDAIVRLALGAEKPEHRDHRRQPDVAVAQPLRVQPVLVELDALRQMLEDGLVQARRQQAADLGLCHDGAHGRS